VGGGLRRFAELVGEVLPRPTKRPPRSALAEARDAVLDEARRQPWAAPGADDLRIISDFIRTAPRHANNLRALATTQGDSLESWELLANAARLERLAWTIEAEIEEWT
jgi:hypothetical protein